MHWMLLRKEVRSIIEKKMMFSAATYLRPAGSLLHYLYCLSPQSCKSAKHWWQSFTDLK
uniref:Uncharacterized protein n=1 Tax=Arundo donax TaxID=35708 RepID=A0A0A9BD55_ARUDO